MCPYVTRMPTCQAGPTAHKPSGDTPSVRRMTTALLSRPAALREELGHALPDRPFTIEFWDGTALPSTSPGPTISVKSPRAIAFLLSAPGELGLGRAYVSGELEVDDLDALTGLISTWDPPSLDRTATARLAIAALRAAGIQRPPTPPASETR